MSEFIAKLAPNRPISPKDEFNQCWKLFEDPYSCVLLGSAEMLGVDIRIVPDAI